MDGSISVWDLREPFNLHLANSKKKAFSSEESVMRSPTYSTGNLRFHFKLRRVFFNFISICEKLGFCSMKTILVKLKQLFHYKIKRKILFFNLFQCLSLKFKALFLLEDLMKKVCFYNWQR